MPSSRPDGRRCTGLAMALVLAAFLGGCAIAPPLTETPTPIAVRRTPLPAFELAGRLSATDGEQAMSGRIEWSHSAASDLWTAYSPLGQILARLERDALGARLVTADGRRLQATSADALLPRVLGVEAPFAELPRWVQATPRAGAEIRRRDESGRPTVVIDDGWQIEYGDYGGPAGDALPHRIDVHRGATRIRLVVDSWDPPALAAARSPIPDGTSR